MTGRILVVDDIDVNRRLLEVRLHAEYFEVITADSGASALRICSTETVDLVLLDVMMPEMDGYEVCRRLKANPRTRHIPIVLVTALDLAADRVRGLDAGADDFLVKPVRDLQLFSRVRSLLRLKIVTDELRARAETTVSVLGEQDFLAQIGQGGIKGQVLILDSDQTSADRLARMLASEHNCETMTSMADVSGSERFDIVILSLAQAAYDPLRLCSKLRSSDATRRLPILLVADELDELRIAKALELGANDYLLRPIDRNELLARVRTQIKKRRYDEGLRKSLRTTIELATIDPLTSLQNRRFLEAHLPAVVDRAREQSRPLTVLMADIDHFKQINDRWGHDVGDVVLREFAIRLKESLRASDLACRYGGEEFTIIMPDADSEAAAAVAERLRSSIAERTFVVAGMKIDVTVSVGLAVFDKSIDDAMSLMKRADRSLYSAKRDGRNRVTSLAAA